VNLARLRQNFTTAAEGYEKLEQAIPVEQMSPLQATICPLERGVMLQTAFLIARFYQELAPLLAWTHGITYPDGLDAANLNPDDTELKEEASAVAQEHNQRMVQGFFGFLGRFLAGLLGLR